MEQVDNIISGVDSEICDIELDYYGTKLAAGTSSGKLYIFNNVNGKMTKISETIAHRGPVFKVGWSHPSFGPIIGTCGFDKKVILFKIDMNCQCEKIYEHELHDNCVQAFKFSPSSEELIFVSGCINGNVFIGYYKDNNITTQKTFAHDFGVTSIDFFNDNKFVTCGKDNLIKIWTYSKEENSIINDFTSTENESNIKDIACKDDKHFASCDDDGNVNYWVLNGENKWESHAIFKAEEKLEKIRFNEERTSIIAIGESGKEYLITDKEINF